jgi:hypothetical protein
MLYLCKVVWVTKKPNIYEEYFILYSVVCSSSFRIHGRTHIICREVRNTFTCHIDKCWYLPFVLGYVMQLNIRNVIYPLSVMVWLNTIINYLIWQTNMGFLLHWRNTSKAFFAMEGVCLFFVLSTTWEMVPMCKFTLFCTHCSTLSLLKVYSFAAYVLPYEMLD